MFIIIIQNNEQNNKGLCVILLVKRPKILKNKIKHLSLIEIKKAHKGICRF